MKFISSFLIALSLLFVISCSNQKMPIKTENSEIKVNVIYGDDDRLDLYQVKDPQLLQLADSTVGLIRKQNLTLGTDQYQIKTNNYGDYYKLCPNEPFREQETAPFCSGFLVAPDIIVTAGHCIRTQSDCNATSFMFGFAMQTAFDDLTTIEANDVYNCSEVITSQINNSGSDFAVIRLDRKVTGHKPLSLRRQGAITEGEDLLVIGHPVGLPTKIAAGSNVRSVESGFFVANLDTYGGNSGSAVFNAVTGDVEGILVRGEVDFNFSGDCRVSNVCENDSCRGEDITKISEVLFFIPPRWEN